MKRKIISTLFALVLVFTLGLVTAVPAAAQATIYVPGDHSTIQAAINAASAGDNIIVAAGTYTEDLTINIANLTIKSASGSGNTTIQLVDGVGIDIQGGADDFTLGGASGEGFTVLSNSDDTTFNIQVANAPSDVTISYNEIGTTGNASMGVSVGAAGASGLTISNNTFTDEAGDGSIWGPNVVDVIVSTNTFNGGAYAVQFSGVTGTSTISNNDISGYTGSGAIVISNGAGTSGLTISGNTISSCSNGVYFVEYCAEGTAANMTTVTVTENTLTDNAKAIRVGDGTHVLASNFTIENNNISGSTTYGLENAHTTETVTAENNWWGTVNGPGHAGNTFNVGAQGDASSDNVDYVPWLDATYATGASFAPVTVGTGTTYHSSIQAGIDAAIEGDIITCKAGEFTEDLTVNTANLTLKSVGGMVNTSIQLTGDVKAGIDIQGGARDFTLGGASDVGFTILPPAVAAGGSFPIQLANAPSDVEISYNAIDTTGPASQGISIGAAGSTGLTISNNAFTAEVDDISIYGPYHVNLTVSDNTFTGPDNTTSGVAMQFPGVTGTSVISGNNITGYGGGISITNGSGVSGLTITGNTVSGCAKGIYFLEYNPSDPPADGNMTTVTITRNTLSTNAVGIYVSDGAHVLASNFVIVHNNISGSTTYGLENAHSTETVNAENNWWGNASGPVPNVAPPYTSYGDVVTPSAKVDYEPWLLAEVEEGVTPTTYEKTLALKDGWTLASVDKEVATGTVWVGTTALVDTETIVAYKYTAGTGYSQVTLATQLTSVDAYYVKTDDGGGVGINYSTAAPGVVTKSLGAGWNIISCASETDAYKLLSQLRYVQVGEQEGVGITNLIGQASYNQYLPTSMSIPLVTDDEWVIISPGGTPVPLNAFDGYWVYMNAAKSFGVIPD